MCSAFVCGLVVVDVSWLHFNPFQFRTVQLSLYPVCVCVCFSSSVSSSRLLVTLSTPLPRNFPLFFFFANACVHVYVWMCACVYLIPMARSCRQREHTPRRGGEETRRRVRPILSACDQIKQRAPAFRYVERRKKKRKHVQTLNLDPS